MNEDSEPESASSQPFAAKPTQFEIKSKSNFIQDYSTLGDECNKSMSSAFVADVQARLIAIHKLLCSFIIKLLGAHDQN